MPPFSLQEIEQAVALVHGHMPPTPQYQWPLLCELTGARLWIKHENHTPTGSFKIRGAITFIDWLQRTHPEISGIVTATRGNHGQGQAREASRAGLKVKIVVPHGNSREKNAAMRGFGAELIEHGKDFDAAKARAMQIAAEESLFMVPAFHMELIRGVTSYAYELFTAQPDLDSVYVPIGLGSGVCGVIAARDALNLKTDVIGVVADKAPGARLSVEQGEIVTTGSADTFADGMAVREPAQEAYDIYAAGTERIVSVSEDQIADAVRAYYRCTHNLAEGAGAVALAALLNEKERMRGKKVGVILSGGNIDAAPFATILQNGTPLPF